MRFRKKDLRWADEAYEARGSRKGERVVFAYAEKRLSNAAKIVVRTNGTAGYFNDPIAYYGPDRMADDGEEQIELLWETLKQTGMA